jgi:phenylacetate-CoA ligase
MKNPNIKPIILDKFINQERRFIETLSYVYNNSKYWKQVIDNTDIDITKIKLKDLQKLPVIDKEILQNNIKDMICVGKSNIIDYVNTSGTTSSPVNIPMTEKDLQRLSQNEYQSMLLTGATNNDIIQICTTLDKQFMAGMAYYLGVRKLGAGVIRLGVDSLETHWKSIIELKPNYLIAVPSFVVKLIKYAKENKIDYQKSSVKKIICIGENIRNIKYNLNSIGQLITQQWDVKLFSTYASTEMATAFTECEYGNGGHHNPELIYIEILDENNNQVPPGKIGELTITTFGVEGLPLIRYKTGDLCSIDTNPCQCGRNTVRLSPIVGRTAQRIKYKGTTFYPSAVFDLLSKFPSINDTLLIIEKDNLENDNLKIHLSIDDLTILKKIKRNIKSTVRVLPEFIIHKSLNSLRHKYEANKKRKLVRVIDLRN